MTGDVKLGHFIPG